MAETVEGIEELMDVVLDLEVEAPVKRRLVRVLSQLANMLEAPPKVNIPQYAPGVRGIDPNQVVVTNEAQPEKAFLPPERVTGNPLVAQK